MTRKQQAAYKPKPRRNNRETNVYQLSEALAENGRAQFEGPKRKTWSTHDLKTVRPLTDNQAAMFNAFYDGFNICAGGVAGTGKSYVALYLALSAVLDPDSKIDKIIIVRSAVPSRDMGHMPGTLEEKASHFEKPYAKMFADFLGRPNSYVDLKEAGIIQFETTSYARGDTWDNAIVVVDEIQNMIFSEIDTVATRLGKCSKLILCGDGVHQQDLRSKEVSGFRQAIQILQRMPSFTQIQFEIGDIVRGPFVRDWIIARTQLGF